MTRFGELFRALQVDFAKDEIKVLSGKGKKPDLRYATARTFMNRLDQVLGPENWWDEYTPGEHSVICRLTIRLPDGSTLTKSDAGGYAGMADQGDDDKSGFSDAFKRACVKFGVGRHLYNDGMPTLRDAVRPEPAETVSDVRPPSGTAVPRTEEIDYPSQAAQQQAAIQSSAEPAGSVPFWDYLNDEVLKANYAYREATGDENGCADVRKAVRSVVDLTYRAGKHTFPPGDKRTAKQWEQVVNEISEQGDNREWMIGYLRSHLKIATETATLESSRAAR